MRNKIYIKLILLLLAGMVITTGCEKVYDGTYNEYDPTLITGDNVGLKYDPDEIEVYPIVGEILSDTPTIAIDDQVVVFGLDTVLHSLGPDAFNYGKAHIDRNTGKIWYDNVLGTLQPGTLSFDVTVAGVNGVAIVKDAFRFKVLEVPVNVTADPDNVEVSSVYEGVISTLTWEEVGNPDQHINEVTYSIKPAVPGFSVDEQGNVKKSVTVETGTYSLTIVATTNLGAKTFPNLISVNVGEAPVLTYMKHDGSGELTKVTLSPGSEYSTTQPELTGMAASGWAIMSDGLPNELVNALSIDDQGVVSVAANAAIPVGDYSIGINITSGSGVDVPFPDKFTLSFQVHTSQILYDDDEFDPANGQISYEYDPASQTHFTYDAGNGVIKGYHDNGQVLNSWATAIIPIADDWNGVKLTISFEEKNGWGAAQDACYQEFVRTLQYSYDQTDWTDIMDASDPDWPTQGSGGFNPVADQEVTGIDITNDTLYVKWHYDNSASSTLTKSVWMLDNLLFKYTINYEPIEE